MLENQDKQIHELKFEIQKMIDENLKVPGIVDKDIPNSPFKSLPQWVRWIHCEFNKRVKNLEVGLVDNVAMLKDNLAEVEDSLLNKMVQERESIMEVFNLDLTDEMTAMDQKIQSLYSLGDQKHKKELEITEQVIKVLHDKINESLEYIS